jgi:hypothetical protein
MDDFLAFYNTLEVDKGLIVMLMLMSLFVAIFTLLFNRILRNQSQTQVVILHLESFISYTFVLF